LTTAYSLVVLPFQEFLHPLPLACDRIRGRIL
jgi:hypothetical protein